ncbi:hypothetical protein MHK_009392 [Candidatus Magnetomorum sp. HK-1]|nr:hypothetical protein MHK_009392 [Candidatus Magnetomorum sp. HK-1]
MLSDAREMLIDVLKENFGIIPEYIMKTINSINRHPILKDLHRKAIKCHDMKSFENNLITAGCTF